jgi:exosortase/archaeosortase family protein
MSSPVERLKAAYLHLPVFLRIFFIRSLLIFIIWKALYLFVLAPTRVPDKYITKATAHSTSFVLGIIDHKLGPSIYYDGYENITVEVNNKRINSIRIADECNALELAVLFVGFLFSLPYTFKKQLLYSVSGLALIYLVNIIRCSMLALIYLSKPDFFFFAHHYLFIFIIYLIIFSIWYKYTMSFIHYLNAKN